MHPSQHAFCFAFPQRTEGVEAGKRHQFLGKGLMVQQGWENSAENESNA